MTCNNIVENIAYTGEIQIQYGLRNGILVDINDIQKNENGKNCNCVCPLCRTSLQARIGTKRRRYFAHNNSDCKPEKVQQTIIHLLAKEVLQAYKKIMLPECYTDQDDTNYFGSNKAYTLQIQRSIVASKETKLTFDNVYLEKKFDDIVPDVIIENNEKILIVEIYVTHKVDEEKKNKIKRMDINALEIDLSDLRGEKLNREEIAKRVIESVDNKIWINNVQANKEFEKLKIKNKEITDKYKQEEQKANELKNEKLRKRIETIENEKEEKIRLEKEEVYKIELNKAENDKLVISMFKNLLFKEEIPYFINIPVLGEPDFLCDRRVWQGTIFEEFIYNKKYEKDGISVAEIINWIYEQKIFKPNKKQMGTYLINGERRLDTSLLYAVAKYLNYLSYIGFVKFKGKQAQEGVNYGDYETVSGTLIPPIKINSDILYKILQSTHIYNEYINNRIKIEIIREEQHRLKEGYFYVLNKKNSGCRTYPYIEDQFGYKWIKCIKCQKMNREDEVVKYKDNYVVCKSCSEFMEKENSKNEKTTTKEISKNEIVNLNYKSEDQVAEQLNILDFIK